MDSSLRCLQPSRVITFITRRREHHREKRFAVRHFLTCSVPLVYDRRWAGAVGGVLRRGGSAVQGAAGRVRVPALWNRGRHVRLAAQLSLRQRSMSILQHPSVRRLQRRRVRVRRGNVLSLEVVVASDPSMMQIQTPCVHK